MGPRASKIAGSLSQKYLELHQAFNALAAEAAHHQNTVPLAEGDDRGLFNSLSRIVAFSDHVHVALNLMGEDVRAIQTTYGEPALAELEDIDEKFDEWFTTMSVANVKVH